MAARVLCLFLLLGHVLNDKPCEVSKTCHDCITNGNVCQWCPAEKFDLENHCRSALRHDSWCSVMSESPKNTLIVTEQEDFNSTLGYTVQLKPQKISIKLRVGIPQTFEFAYKASEDYPVDIYFLLDASNSMRPLKQQLHDQSQNIYNTMRDLTKNVYFGVGTFNDKNVVPINDNITDSKLYSFKHELDLTSDVPAFQKRLKELIEVSGAPNRDHPESAFDGIAQAITCKDKVKWRKQSRKILFLMTDAYYHAAGDGKTSGITRPYDGNCYLNEYGLYDMATKLDFPSAGIIKNMAVSEQITIIINAQVDDDRAYYNMQSNERGIFYKKYRGKEGITQLLKKIYNSITKNINLQLNKVSEQLSITFEPNCQFNSEREDSKETRDKCSIQKGQEKKFKGIIKLDHYFGMKSFEVSINPKGLKESVVLKIEVITDCACDKVAEDNSTQCSHAGRWSCGVCECLEENTGPTCNCPTDQSLCRNGIVRRLCSDHGSCICNQCTCDRGYGGKLCQTLLDNCPRGQGSQICSGQGECQDGECICELGYKGELCDCPTLSKPCMKNGEECSNRGKCECGNCVCNSLPKWDVRPRDEFCSKTTCVDCHNKQCKNLIECEECLHSGKSCSDVCGDKLIIVDHDIPEDEKSWNHCTNVRVDFGCYANYSYIYNDNDTITLYLLQRSCEKSQIYYGVMALALLVLIGLATLVVWKLLTDARDRREYNQFMEAFEASDQVQENDIYKSPTTQYLNPAFQHSTVES